MTLIAVYPALVAAIGLVAWCVSSHPKLSEAGRIAFFCGLLVTCFSLAQHTIRIG